MPLRFSRSIKYPLGQNKDHKLHMVRVVKYLKRIQVEFNTHRTKTTHNGIVETNLTSQQGFQYQLNTYKGKINKKLHVAWVVNQASRFQVEFNTHITKTTHNGVATWVANLSKAISRSNMYILRKNT